MTTPADLSAQTWNYWHETGPNAARLLEVAHPSLIGSPQWHAYQQFAATQYPRDEEMCALLGAPLAPPVDPPTPEIPPSVPLIYDEASQFTAGGRYERLSDPTTDEPWEIQGQAVPILNSHHRAQVDHAWPFPTSKWKGRRLLGNDAAAAWGDHGPLWMCRLYDVVGLIDDLHIMRPGDYAKGREGHGIYFNLMGDVTVRDYHAIQCGGQALQVVSPWERTKETAVPQAEWPTSANALSIERIYARDCGIINVGLAVRASWPIALYGLPCAIHLGGGAVETLESPEFSHHGQTYRSHGALFVGQPAQGKRVPKLTGVSFRTDLIAPDREDFRLWAVDLVEFEGFAAARTGLSGFREQPVLAIVDDCKRVVLRDWLLDRSLLIQLHAASAPYSAAHTTFSWDGTGTWEWKRP